MSKYNGMGLCGPESRGNKSRPRTADERVGLVMVVLMGWPPLSKTGSGRVRNWGLLEKKMAEWFRLSYQKKKTWGT